MHLIFHRMLGRLALLCMVLVSAPAAIAQQLPEPVAQALARAGISPVAVGIHVQDVTVDLPLLTSNAATPFNPASTMKLLTTNAALDLLGPSFTWKTQAFATGVQTGDILLGDLIIKGSGDPKLVLEAFWIFLRDIRARGIREIRGNLVLDRSLFAPIEHDPANFDGDPLKPYNAGPDALLLNYKTFTFRFMPNPALGLVSVAVDPPVAGYPVIGPKLDGGECGDWRQKLLIAQDGTAVDFAGVYPVSCGEKTWYVHAWKMSQTRYMELMFRRLWADLGGVFTGEVTEGLVPPDARFLAQRESVSLAEVTRDINKFSNNVMARQLLLTLSARFAGTPATVANGAQVIQTWLATRALDMPELVIDNGSGLSRDERISAGSLARMLVGTYRSPVMPEFIASLPLAGHDGTMRARLNGNAVAGNAHIKTGYLNEVRAIAGYVLAKSGKRYAVVFLINHPNAARGHEAQDALLHWVYHNG